MIVWIAVSYTHLDVYKRQDIDNVIADLDKTFLEEFEKEDKNKRNKGIINKKAKHITRCV